MKKIIRGFGSGPKALQRWAGTQQGTAPEAPTLSRATTGRGPGCYCIIRRSSDREKPPSNAQAAGLDPLVGSSPPVLMMALARWNRILCCVLNAASNKSFLFSFSFIVCFRMNLW